MILMIQNFESESKTAIGAILDDLARQPAMSSACKVSLMACQADCKRVQLETYLDFRHS